MPIARSDDDVKSLYNLSVNSVINCITNVSRPVHNQKSVTEINKNHSPLLQLRKCSLNTQLYWLECIHLLICSFFSFRYFGRNCSHPFSKQKSYERSHIPSSYIRVSIFETSSLQ